jgi:predicted RND superfamily exporter protein
MVRDLVAKAFGWWGAFVARHPWPVLLAVLATCLALGMQTPRIVLDTSTEGFLRPNDPTLVAYDAFRHTFGRDDFIVVGVEGDDIFSLPFLERLRAFHRDLEKETPHVDEVTSMLNARWTRGEDDQLVVEDLMEQWPRSAADLAALRERVYSNPLYVDNLVTRDGRLTTVLIDLDTYVQDGTDAFGAPILRFMRGSEIREVVDAVAQVIARHRAPHFRLYAAGTPWMTDRLAYRIVDDAPALVRKALLAMAIVLFVLFGSIRAVVLPLLVVGLTLVCTLGLMPLLAMPYQIPTQIVPVSLLAIGIGDSIHILALYYQRRRDGEDKATAIAGAFHHSGPAVLMTSLTTAGAMLSFLSAPLAPIANIGVLVPAGVMIALGMTVTVLPTMLRLLPERSVPARRRLAVLDHLIVGSGAWATRRPWTAVAASAVVLVVSVTGAVRAHFSHNPVRWFPKSDSFRVSTEHLNERLGGILALEVLFDTGREDGAKDPRLLHALDRITALNARYRSRGDGLGGSAETTGAGKQPLYVAKTISIVDLLKEIHRALNGNRDDYYTLPDRRDLVAQELLLFELSGSDDLEDLVDYRYTTARMTMRVPWTDATQYSDFVDGLLALQRGEIGDAATVTVTGRIPLLTRTLTAVIHSMARSYVLAFAAVAPLMMLLLGSFRLGLLSMIPNLLPIIAALGLMGWFGLPLDAFNLLVGSIVLGLAVDDTIHFMHGFYRERSAEHPPAEAVRLTLQTTGQAMFFTTLILCTGFAIYATAYMRNFAGFGLITAFALAMAFIADVVLSPALVVLAERRARSGDAGG